jgi:hypothetical protein
MYTATLEPLLRECNEAVELAKAGDIDASRIKLDRIRYYRSVLAHSQNRGKDAGSPQESSVPENPELLQTYLQVATAVNERLQFLHQWIAEARASFSLEELRQSIQGFQLYIDDALPGIWDFTTDVAVLTDEDGEALREALRLRGQSKFIWMTTLSESRVSDLGNSDTIFVGAGEQIEVDALEPILSRYSLPRVALIAMNYSATDEKNFHLVTKSIGTCVIGGATTQWLPQMTAEQWLTLIPKLANLPSVMALKDQFEGADVLIVSPGPSLTEDLELLASVHNRFLVIATMKALAALFDAGIRPDLAIWQDPQNHSDAIPKHAEIGDVGLILNEGCHPAFYEAGFATHFAYPEPGFRGTSLSAALHGEETPLFIGTSVSSLSAIMVLAMGAKSVTLLGQDLSIGGGLYVGEAGNDAASESEEKIHLTCKGINGEMLPTLPNYFSFIGEFQNVAQTFKDQAKLINATASGAFLEGWDHIPFSKHPLVTEDSGERYQIDVRSKSLISEGRVQRVLEALADTEAQLDHAAKISEEIKSYCLASIESGDNDVTVIDLLEQRLKLIFDEECPVLRYYTSSQSLALTAAIGSVQSLEENLRLSADYYQSIGVAARKLMKSCQTSRTSMEGVIE